MKIPINLKSGEIDKANDDDKNVIVGIDLGTTNSLIAIIDNENNPIALKDDSGYTLVPSIVHFTEDGKVVVGNEAKQYLESKPNQTIYSVKRLLGKSYKDISQETSQLNYTIIENNDEYSLVKIKVGDKFFSPIELSSHILKELKNRAETVLNKTITQAVITVPAYFNDSQRQATRDAGKLAGLDVLRIVNEPTAASLAYGLGVNREDKRIIAVYDLGGGTFDISILQLESGIFEVLSTNGDTHLGGDDIDQLIIDHWKNTYQLVVENTTEKQILRLLAEEAKKQLSFNAKYNARFQEKDIELSLTLFNELIKPIVDRTIQSCKNAVKDANLEIAQIDEVIVVGGSTRIPMIKKSVSEFFNRPVNDTLNPDEVVALGAAVQADILAGNRKDILLLDVTPLSLGIETLGGLMDVIIPRNNKIPAKAGRQYTTSVDGQKNLSISVYQGERDLVQYNRKLGSFILKDIPPMPAGFPKIDISFILDADGILTVKAKELRSETSTQVEIKSTYGISEEDMAMMLLDSIKNAKDDMEIKAKLEAVNEANSLVLASKKFLEINKDLMTAEEKVEFNNLLSNLEASIASNDKDIINKAMDDLNNYANPIAQRSMDITIQKAVIGKTIDGQD